MFSSAKHTFSQTKYVAQRAALGLHVIDEVKRFRALVAVLFCSICVSLVFAFDLFSDEFQSRFHLSDGDLSTISTVGVVFCYFVIPYGVLYDHTGPFPLLVIAGVTALIGCLGLGLVFDGKVKGNTATISVFYALMNTCSGLFDAASIVTLAELFPRNRGPVIGLAKVMTGLGSSVLSSINRGFFSNNIRGFIYFIMALTVAVSLVAMFLIALPPYFVNSWRARHKTEEQTAALTSLKAIYAKKLVPMRRLAYGYVIVVCLVIFFAVTAPMLAYMKVSGSGKAVVGGITVVLCMSFWVMAMPIPWLDGVNEPAEQQSSTYDAEGEMLAVEGSKLNCPTSAEPLGPANEPLSISTASSDDARAQTLLGAEAVIEDGPQDPRYGGTIWETLTRPDIWLILITFVCQGALGTIVMYNGSTIYVARTGRPRTAELGSLYTPLIGVGSAVGRILMGLFEAYVQHQDPGNRKVCVTMALPVAPIIATIAGILILVLPGDALLLPYILVYFEEGVFNGVRALIFPCIFASHHGILYNMSFCTNAIGVICFNRFLFGLTVDQERKKLGHTVEQGCTSRACVQTPIIVVTCMAVFAALLATVVHLRYARFVAQCRKASKKTASLGHFG
ncbi:hypothetical protein LSCM1_00290 [Leishmania martiniquensis]|uniref:Nodulin-like domain-containing protein n=1 Tax=Leishmania martiniquensis TaxID=1580590 RepID=A0A836GSX1_9TRYP|nr:hypothetical protein LSCM1_00290 [Leishmania martiniquensis]